MFYSTPKVCWIIKLCPNIGYEINDLFLKTYCKPQSSVKETNVFRREVLSLTAPTNQSAPYRVTALLSEIFDDRNDNDLRLAFLYCDDSPCSINQPD
ncbi:hypothetical protein TNCV_4359041 [Trichonephila clavipes]|nr:hypothetical protein TNCV_4359041 [Trichonephila clavipes]